MSDGIEADVKAAAKAAKAAIDSIKKARETKKKVSEAIDSIYNDGDIATTALIGDSDKIVGIDNGDAPINGDTSIGDARIEDVMDGSFVNTYFSDGGDISRKSNDYSSFTQVTVSEPTYSAPKKG